MNAVWRNCQRSKRNGGEYVTTEICPGSRDEQNDNAETQLTDRTFKREKLWQNARGKSKNWKQFKKGDSCDHRRQGRVICTHNTLVSLILEEWENSKENIYDWKTKRSRAQTMSVELRTQVTHLKAKKSYNHIHSAPIFTLQK